jgi:sporulation integral membrane protein YtvI
MPFIIGFLLAAIVQPLSRRVSAKTRLDVKICAVSGVLLLIVLIGLLFFGISYLIVNRFDLITSFAFSLADSLKFALNSVSEQAAPFFNQIKNSTGIQFDGSISGFSNKLLEITKIPDLLMKFIQSAFSGIAPLFLNTVVTIVAGCFIAADYKIVTAFILRLLPKRYRTIVGEIKNFFFKTVLKIIRAYALLMLITFCELSLGLFLIRVNNPVGVAAIIAIIDIMPVLGTGTVMIPWAIIELLLGNTMLGICLFILYAVITVVRNILEPKIVGSHIGLHPIITLTALIVGLKAFGIIGMIAFPITILIIKELYLRKVIKIPSFEDGGEEA